MADAAEVTTFNKIALFSLMMGRLQAGTIPILRFTGIDRKIIIMWYITFVSGNGVAYIA